MPLQTIKFYKVQFYDPIDGSNDFYFRTIPAIFEMFTDNQVGKSILTIQNNPPRDGKPVTTKKCVIYRCNLFWKSHG